MTPLWLPTAALGRALVVGAVGVVAAVLAGTPVAVVLVAPLVVLAGLGLVQRPRSQPVVDADLGHRWLHEGQGTTSTLRLDAGGAEHVVRVLAPTPYVAQRPARAVGGPASAPPVVELGPRRWGRRTLGAEEVALTSAWGGYRWGPLALPGEQLRVLPQTAPFDSRAQTPRPVGLVGHHRSRRLGSGVEFADIRPFRPGDRLRRISWRVSVRTDELHVTTSPAEEDAGILLVVDALADHGLSEGVDGAASSLDLAVRGAAALAEHHVRAGDRVALRVVGGADPLAASVGPGTGTRHLRVLLDHLALVRPGPLESADEGDRLDLRITGGSVVLVLSPLLGEAIVTAVGSLVRGRLPVVVVDTLPPDLEAQVPEGTDARLADLAWRMRRLERDQVLAALAGLGCPVVPWRGPGTLDAVLRRLARAAP